jgi:hypothetical protein
MTQLAQRPRTSPIRLDAIFMPRDRDRFAGPFGGIRCEERRSHRASYTERRSVFAITAGTYQGPLVGAERGGFRRGNLARSVYIALDRRIAS